MSDNQILSTQEMLRQALDELTAESTAYEGSGSQRGAAGYQGGSFGTGPMRASSYEEEADSLWESLGQFGSGLKKGTASGLTFGASEFAGEDWQVNWDDMTGVQKAGYIAGESLSMLVPFAGMGKAARFATKFAPGGARSAIKAAAKKTIAKPDVVSGGMMKQIKKQAQEQGVSVDKIKSQLPTNIQNKLYKDLNKWEKGTAFKPIQKPWLDKVYQQATQGRIKDEAQKALKQRVGASIHHSYKVNGLKASSAQINKLADNFVSELGSGVKFQDTAGALARLMGQSANSGKLAETVRTYLSHSFNTSAMMITDQMIRSKVHSMTRDDHEFKPSEALMSGAYMGFLFPAVQAIPNVRLFGKKLGTGHMRVQEAFPKIMQRFSRTNYNSMIKKSGEEPVRRLLQRQTDGGLFDLVSDSRLGQSFWKVNGREYKGGWDIISRAMSRGKDGAYKSFKDGGMPTEDVVSLLKGMNRVVSKESSKEWFKKYMIDWIGSAPRAMAGMSLMGGTQHWDSLIRGEMDMSEFTAHMMAAATMTKNRGGWGLQKHWDFQADMAPYERRLTELGMGGNTLKEVMGYGDYDVETQALGLALKDTKAGRAIHDAYEAHLSPETTPEGEKGQSGYQPGRHKLAKQYEVVYNAIKAEMTPRGSQVPDKLDVMNMQYSGAELDNISNSLKEVQLDDGAYLKDIGISQFMSRSLMEISNGTRKGYEGLLKTLAAEGLPIQETYATKEGAVKFQVGEIKPKDTSKYKDLGVLQKYNELVNKLEKMGIVEIINNPLSRTPDQLDNFGELAGHIGEDAGTGIYRHFNQLIKSLNKTHNMPDVLHDIADNQYLNQMGKQGDAKARTRIFDMLNNSPKTEGDSNLLRSAEKMLDRGHGKIGLLSHVEKYNFDYSEVKKDFKDVKNIESMEGYTKSELQEGLRPMLELLRFNNDAPIDATKEAEPINVKEAVQIIDQVKDITNLMSKNTRETFYKEGANFFIKDMLDAQGLDGRVINSVVELSQLGLGHWSQADKKISVPKPDSVRDMAMNDPEIDNADIPYLMDTVNNLYEAIGDRHLKQEKYYINQTDEYGYKSPSVSEYVKIYENFRTDRLKDFLDTSADDITMLATEEIGAEGNLKYINDALAKISMHTGGADKAGREIPGELQKISGMLKLLRGSTDTGQHPLHKKIDKIIGELDVLRNDMEGFIHPDGTIGDEIGRNVDPTDDYGKLKDQGQIIEELLSMEGTSKYQVQKLITGIRKSTFGGELSKEASIRLQENMGQALHQILAGHAEGAKSRPLSELIQEVNETKSWTLLNKAFKEIQTQYEISIDKTNIQEVPKSDMQALEGLHEDKKIHVNSETVQTIAQRFRLTDPANPNDLDGSVVDLVARAKSTEWMQSFLIPDLTKIVKKNIRHAGISQVDQSDAIKQWDRYKFTFANQLLRRKQVTQAELIYDGENLVSIMNSEHMTRETPLTEWVDGTGYDVTYVQDGIIKKDDFSGYLKKGDFKNISKTLSSNDAINALLKDGMHIIPQADYDAIKDVADGNGFTMDHISRRIKELGGGESLRENGLLVHLTPGNRLLFHGTKANYTKLNTDFVDFYNNVKFRDISVKDESGRKINVAKESLQKRFEKLFGNLKDVDNPDRTQTALKLHALFEFGSKPAMFNKWLANVQIGNMDARAVIESNMVKRGWLIDGGTTMKPHPAITKSMANDASLHPDVQEYAQYLVDNNDESQVAIFDDESSTAGTNIFTAVKDAFKSKSKTYKKGGDDLSEAIMESQLTDIDNGEIPSLYNPSTDGQKYVSLRRARYEIALKGENPDVISGYKTIVFQLGENSMLGKGYVVYNPKVATEMPKNVDMAMGVSAAKEFPLSVKPLDVPGKLWYQNLKNAGADNIVKLKNENIGIGFVAKKTKGVSVSQSMTDFENAKYNKDLAEVMGIDRNIRILDNATHDIVNDEGQMLDFLMQSKRDEGLTLSQGSISLVNDIINYGGKYNNPAIKPQVDRALRDYYFKELNSLTTKHGRDLTITTDESSSLVFPEIASFVTSDGTREIDNFRKNKTFGEISPSRDALSEPLENLMNTTFAIKYKGVDFLVDGLGKEASSPLVDALYRRRKDVGNKIWLKGDSKNNKFNKSLADLSKKQKLEKEVLSKIEPLIEYLNRKMANKDKKLSMADIFDLMKGGRIQADNGWTKIKIEQKVLDLIKDFNIGLTVDGIAIPLKGKDKVVQRVGDLHDQAGLVKMNHYDERVVHQRDNDGDHFYIYNQLPLEISKKHSQDQAFMKDFKMMKKDAPDIDIFGILGEGHSEEAGVSGRVGIGDYIDHLDGQRGNIGITKGDIKAATLADMYDIKIGNTRFTQKFNQSETYDTPSGSVLNRLLTLFQNAVDINGGTARVMPDLKRFFRYGETTETDLKWAADKVSGVEKNLDLDQSNSLFMFANPDDIYNLPDKRREYSLEVDRDIQDVMVNTLKGIGVIGSDVYDGSLKSSPTPDYINQKYYDLKMLFTAPEKYLVTKVAERYAGDRANGRRKLFELMRIFYQDGSDYRSEKVTSGDWYNKFLDDMITGKISENFSQNVRLTFGKFTEPSKQWAKMFDAHPQGKVLREVVARQMFQDPEGIKIAGDPKKGMKTRVLHRKIGSVVQDALSRINLLQVSGKNLNEYAEDFTWSDEVMTWDPASDKIIADEVNSVNRGAIRGALQSLFKRLQNDKAYFESIGPKGEQQILSIERKLANVESGLSILDTQYAQGIIGNEKMGSKIVDGVGGEKRVKKDTFVLYVKGGRDQVANQIKENTIDLEGFERHGFVKADDTYESYSGITYVEIPNPIMHENVSKKHRRYSDALRQMTDMTDIRNIGLDDIQQLSLIGERDLLQRQISDNYSRSIKDGKTAALSRKIWSLSDSKDMMALDKFYETNLKKLKDANPELDDAKTLEWLTKYLLKPKPLMSKYTSDPAEGIERPYYAINERLQGQVYKYLSTGQRKINGYDSIVEKLINEQEGRVSGTYTHANMEADNSFNMMQDGYNYERLGDWADVVKTMTGPDFYSPFWKEYKDAALHGYTGSKVMKSVDGHKTALKVDPEIDPEGC